MNSEISAAALAGKAVEAGEVYPPLSVVEVASRPPTDHPAESFPILTDDQFARCVNIWSALRAGHMTRDEANREIQYVEQGLPRCESCDFRSGTVADWGYKVCASCRNGGRRP